MRALPPEGVARGAPPHMLRGLLLGVASAGRDGRIAHGRRVDLGIVDGHIASIEPARRAAPESAPGVLDARGLIGFPALVNAHVHSNEMFEQGAYDAVPLEQWLVLCYPPLAGERAAPRLNYLRAMMMAMQCMRSGVGAVHDDFVNPADDPERLEAVLSVYADSGMRAAVAITLTDKPCLDGLADGRALCPPALSAQLDALHPRSVRDQIRFYEAAQRRMRGRRAPRLGLTLGPRGPQRCTPKLMRSIAELSDARVEPVHMHVLKRRAQWLAGLRLHNKSLVQVLDEVGLLNERLTMNHAIWLTGDDVARMRARGAMTVRNPMSNFKLSSGLSPVKRLLSAGIAFALGSDGPATGDSANFPQSLRFAALVHKLDVDCEGQAPDADAIVTMATSAGARSMGNAAHSADVMVNTMPVIKYNVARRGNKLGVVGPWDTREVGVNTRIEDQALLDAINKVVTELKAEGYLTKLEAKWFK